MSFTYEDRLSNSPYLQTIWHTQGETDGCFLSAADGSWDFLLIKEGGETRFCIAGAATKAASVPYTKGVEYLGIRFKVGSFMPQLPATTIRDNMIVLAPATSTSIWFHDTMLPLPNFDNVEGFINRLVRNHLLDQDALVDAVLEGDTQEMSLRSVQRHFLRATGLTYKTILQIERARHSVSLLQQGKSIVETAFAAGYTDQAHMTKSLKHFIGQTPAQIVRANQP